VWRTLIDHLILHIPPKPTTASRRLLLLLLSTHGLLLIIVSLALAAIAVIRRLLLFPSTSSTEFLPGKLLGLFLDEVRHGQEWLDPGQLGLKGFDKFLAIVLGWRIVEVYGLGWWMFEGCEVG
jgi:hypothetical protein